MTTAEVWLWGTRIGAVTLPAGERFASFEYDPDFRRSRIELSPLMMPLEGQVYRFPALAIESFHGLPGLLADALPDKYGNALIDAWLATQGRTAADFNAVERLCYTGARGMGALEFRPAQGPVSTTAEKIEIEELVKLASDVLTHRSALKVTFAGTDKAKALRDILRVGTSAGGARAKAIIAWNPESNEVRSGQVTAPAGFEYWLMKFDGVESNKDHDLADPQGYSMIEYAYSLMAVEAGVEMAECRLFDEGPRRHFMTRRFDRPGVAGERIHMQSLNDLSGLDFRQRGAHDYGALFQAADQLGIDARDQLFRRMVFNVLASNHDDHTKNHAFLLSEDGRWELAPAFDLTFAYNPQGFWTSQHLMSVNGRFTDIRRANLLAVADRYLVGGAARIVREVQEAVEAFPEFARAAGVAADRARGIEARLADVRAGL